MNTEIKVLYILLTDDNISIFLSRDSALIKSSYDAICIMFNFLHSGSINKEPILLANKPRK